MRKLREKIISVLEDMVDNHLYSNPDFSGDADIDINISIQDGLREEILVSIIVKSSVAERCET